jgi:hypothetical protein
MRQADTVKVNRSLSPEQRDSFAGLESQARAAKVLFDQTRKEPDVVLAALSKLALDAAVLYMDLGRRCLSQSEGKRAGGYFNEAALLLNHAGTLAVMDDQGPE